MNKPKCALLIGCNYSNTTTSLKGCTIDAINMKSILIDAYQYDQSEIILLRDDDQDNLPIKSSILNNLNKLISNSYKYSELCIYYSGHGSELTNYPDTVIVPCDYIYNGCISNDDMYEIIKGVQCPLKIIIDSLYTNGLNLQYAYIPVYGKPDPNRIIKPDIKFIINNGIIINQLITLFSRNDLNKITDSILSIIRSKNYSIKYNDLLYNVKNIILYSSQQLSINNNYLIFLYGNYKLLVETVNNLITQK